MADLFRIGTDRARLSWSGPARQISTIHDSIGRLMFRPLRSKSNMSAYSWRTGVPTGVAENVELEAGPVLFEETSYSILLESEAGTKVELRHRDPLITSALARTADGRQIYGTINFRSQVGLSEFYVAVDGILEFSFTVEVFPSKLAYSDDYQAMVADIQDIVSNLALEYLRSTYQFGSAASAVGTSQLEWLILLRHVVDDLERGLRYVQRQPRRRVHGEITPTRLERLRRSNSHIRRNLLHTRSGISGVTRSTLPERRAQNTLDTPEHRWLAQQLSRIRRELASIRAKELAATWAGQGLSKRQEQIVAEVTALEYRIAELEHIEPLQAARGQPVVGFTSIQLQSAPGYAEAYRACLILLQGLRIGGGPLELSVKDVHLLYEYWCYLALVRMLAEILGEEIPSQQLLAVENHGLRIRLARGKKQRVKLSGNAKRQVEISYNPEFNGADSLLVQKPDIVVTLEDPDWPAIRLVLDAKYRLDTSDAYDLQFGSPGPPADAINVLHRYRDAIVEQVSNIEARSSAAKKTVVEGVALFPYTDVRGDFAESRLHESLEKLGIGALPFLPGETQYVETWLRSILERSGWETATKTVAHAVTQRLSSWRAYSHEGVLVGVLRNRHSEHLEWIKQNRIYYTPLTPTQPRQFSVKWFAVYIPATRNQSGAVRYAAPVEEIEVRRRDEVSTPWAATGRRDQMVVVYRLGPLEELSEPIENLGKNGKGVRFSHNRWTSRLGLLRASDLHELFLETGPEWELYETLKAMNIPFTLSPGRVTALDPNNPSGRARFCLEHAEIMYLGSAGFRVQRAGKIEMFNGSVREVVRWTRALIVRR